MLTYIPSGRERIPIEIDKSRVVTSRIEELPAVENGRAVVENALQNPIASPPLRELAKTAKSCVILISDHTRPVPSQDILPPMLAELRAGNPFINITLLVATGCHRATTGDELKSKLGEEIYSKENIVVHDCDDKDSLVNIGILPSGAPLILTNWRWTLTYSSPRALLSRTSSRASPAAERACCRASATARPCWGTTAGRSLRTKMQGRGF